jgi:integrase
MSRQARIPTYRLHKQSGHAIVTLTDGLGGRRDVLLGKHGTPHTAAVCKRCQGTGRIGWARKLINAAVGCIRRMFKWGVAEEMIPPSVYHGLLAVEGLKKGRCRAREMKPVRPVAEEHVEAVLPLLMAPVRAMVQIQQLTGMRPGEVIIMRPCDIDRGNGRTWVYRPDSHKTEHHDIARVVFLGPKAQAILTPFLARDPGAYCFGPREAMEEFRQKQRQARKTKVQPSQQDRRLRKPRKQPGDRYSVDTYGNAIERACLKAGVPSWQPNQLRHSKATEIRREIGLDAARAVLGHRSPTITETYAEIDQAKAAEVMERLG